jgi:HD-like signal output (HDOD) protein/nitrogen-specific signal transduction histidine kinase
MEDLKKSIGKHVSTLKNLPTLPHILVKLIRACDREKTTLREISGIVEKDPSLSGKILRLVNSAYYRLPKKITSMEQAVGFLGTSTIKNIAVSASVLRAFDRTDGNATLNLKLFWWHSLRCAVTARLIARRLKYNSPEEAFLAGLLHDIGRLVLWVNFKKEYGELLNKYSDRPDLLLAGEVRLGVTHCEIGAWLLQRWNLQSFLSDAVLYHHEPAERIMGAFSLVQIIFSANVLSQGPRSSLQAGQNTVEKVLGLSQEAIGDLQDQADGEVVEVANSLEIEIEPPEEGEKALTDKDRRIESDLIGEVQNVSLLLGTLRNLVEAEDEEAILKALEQGFRVLFDTNDVFFFLIDPDKQGLVGKSVSGEGKSSLVDGLLIPLGSGQSLFVSCLDKRAALDSFSLSPECPLALIDEQIIHFLNKEGILCLPLAVNGDAIGIILLGLDRSERDGFQKHQKLLDLFTRQAAVALHSNLLRRRQMQKIQSEGALASSDMARRVAHEVNNPLSIIKNYLKILSMKLAGQDLAQDEIRIINEEIDRIALILRTLTAFSGEKTPKLERVDINVLITDLIKISKDYLAKDARVDIHAELDPALPKPLSDGDSLKQVFINLTKNAAEAMDEGGHLYITTRRISAKLGGIDEVGDEGVRTFVEITFRDDGPGIVDEVKERLFEPFVTSKREGHSGVGLSIAFQAVKALGGTLSCESQKGKGTTFKISLPVEPQG